ncbi:MAG: isopeptide-forming domain-containing fimbrial protein [Blautia massiliensis (ex Durand et al. 2017)]
MEKEADKTTAENWTGCNYTITGTIPDTTGYAQHTYKIHDTLTEVLIL